MTINSSLVLALDFHFLAVKRIIMEMEIMSWEVNPGISFSSSSNAASGISFLVSDAALGRR